MIIAGFIVLAIPVGYLLGGKLRNIQELYDARIGIADCSISAGSGGPFSSQYHIRPDLPVALGDRFGGIPDAVCVFAFVQPQIQSDVDHLHRLSAEYFR